MDPHGLFSISAVERDTGISKDMLRVWERRYGFPQPLRDQHGDRRYTSPQVDKLKVIKRLLDQGYRPGKLIAASLPELSDLAGSSVLRSEPPSADAGEIVALLRSHDVDAVRERLQHLLARQGLQRFVLDTTAPLTTLVGQAWMRGDLAVFEEHLYTELIGSLLRSALGSLPVRRLPPRILLTSLPGEQHGLGLLMVEALATLEGANCVALGVETPATELAAAARAQRCDVVGLSFSAQYGNRRALASLHEVRARLPLDIALWAGGAAVVGTRRAPPGVLIVRSLGGLAECIAEWRAADRRGEAHGFPLTPAA